VRVRDFYDDHPITASQILAAVSERGRVGPLSADDLFDFDQDHYGGIAAVDVLATRARIDARSRVLDVCAGLAGPARFLASRRGCRVVAIELHAGRAAGARRLTDEWRRILRGRLEMYRGLHRAHVRRVGEHRYLKFLEVYAFFARLVEDGKIGGGRFSATA
jgi:hypothetical protein